MSQNKRIPPATLRVADASVQFASHIWKMAATAALALVLLACAGSAQAAPITDLCPPGSGAGQCTQPTGIAVDAETGRIYVADTGNDRIQVFDEDGNPEGAIGAGLLSSPSEVAVDNDPASPVRHDIFVLDRDHARVLRFGPAGALQLGIGWGVRDGAEEAQTCGPEATPSSAACLSGIAGKGECQLSAGFRGSGSHIAVGPGGLCTLLIAPR